MSIDAKSYPNFEAGFRAFYADEISGEAFFAALAQAQTDPHRAKAWQRMADIERATLEALTPAATELRVIPADLNALRAEGRSEALEWLALGWNATLELMRNEFPSYLTEFSLVRDMAPAKFAPLIQLLCDHEIAFIDFAAAELAGDRASIAVLDRFLTSLPATWA